MNHHISPVPVNCYIYYGLCQWTALSLIPVYCYIYYTSERLYILYQWTALSIMPVASEPTCLRFQWTNTLPVYWIKTYLVTANRHNSSIREPPQLQYYFGTATTQVLGNRHNSSIREPLHFLLNCHLLYISSTIVTVSNNISCRLYYREPPYLL